MPLPLPRRLHYTTISDRQAYAMGFDFQSLGEFDLEKDIACIENILRELDVEPVRLSYGATFMSELERERPLLLWNLNSGVLGFSREAQVPAICEMLAIPLVGPRAWTGLVTQDKSLACCWVASECRESVAIAPHVLIREQSDIHLLRNLAHGVRYIIKPNHDESSRGITADSVQSDLTALEIKVLDTLVHWGPVRVERFIAGVNISANAATDEKGRIVALEPIFVEVEELVDSGLTKLNHQRTITPVANKDPGLANRIKRLVMELVRIFRFRHYARFDLRLEEDTGILYFLEANICPSFEPEDDFAIAARHSGITFKDLIRNSVAAGWRDACCEEHLSEVPAMVHPFIAHAIEDRSPREQQAQEEQAAPK